MGGEDPNSVTRLLLDWRQGDERALDRLLPLIYDELRSLAGAYMKRERPEHTLQATALVHEAYVRLINMEISWQDRAHFFAVAARSMRRLLVDHARARLRDRRGAGATPVSLDENLLVTPPRPVDLVGLDRALDKLARFDPAKSRAIELHYFGGLTYEETASVLQVAPSTVHREVTIAKAWLHRELNGSAPHGA